MAMVLLAAFNSIIAEISYSYARHYAISSADALSAHIVKEIGLMSKAAHSDAVTDWLADEDDYDKKILAYQELSGIVDVLYSSNLYIGVENSLNEYNVDQGYKTGAVNPFTTLEEDDPEDSWYFLCAASDKEYLLSVDIDHVLQRKRVWIDYKVIRNGVLLGVISSGLEFSHVVGELFSQYDDADMRGLIVDADGIINMDSSLLNNEVFLFNEFETRFYEEYPDPASIEAMDAHLSGINGYFESINSPIVVKLPSGRYRYMTIAPIRFTDWSAVILYNSSSMLNMSLFLPLSAIMLILLVLFTFAINAVNYRLIFRPLGKLNLSLARLKENGEEFIYGIERDDEFGNLSNTIKDLFSKANIDALTNVYNRRFMENTLHYVFKFLSRSNGLLSVIMIDVDHFKRYNDTYGHDQGDVCLKSVAQALAGGISRSNDFVARYGGEEFIIVLPNTGQSGVRVLAEKFLADVRALSVPHANSDTAPYVTISAGVASGMVSHTQRWEEYVKRADEALYLSKQNGRDRCTYLEYVEPKARE